MQALVFLGAAQILNFREISGGGGVGRCQCLDMSVTRRPLSQDAGLPRGQGGGSVGPHLGSSVCRPGWKVATRPAAPWGCCWSTPLRSVSPAVSSPERFLSALCGVRHPPFTAWPLRGCLHCPGDRGWGPGVGWGQH